MMGAARTLRPIALALAFALAASIAGCAGRPRGLATADLPGASEVIWTQHDSVLAVALEGRGISLIESATGRELRAWRLPDVPANTAFGLAASASGETLAVATADSVRVFRTRDLSLLFSTPGHAITLALSGDGSRLLWSDGTIVLLQDVRSGVVGHQDVVTVGRGALRWVPRLDMFAFPIDRRVLFVRSNGRPEIDLSPFHDAAPRRIAVPSEGRLLAVAESTTYVSFWDPAAHLRGWRLELLQAAQFEPLAISRNAVLLATARQGHARVLAARNGSAVADWTPHRGAAVLDLAFAADGRRLATVGADGSVRTWAMPAASGHRR